MASENKTVIPLRNEVESDNGLICSPSTVISMATGGGLVMILLIALIIVLLLFKREIRQYRRAKSLLLASVTKRSLAVGSDTPLPLDRGNHLSAATLINRISNATQASMDSTLTASNCSNRISCDSSLPTTRISENTTIDVREKRSSTYEDIEGIQWSINELYETSETDCYIVMSQTSSKAEVADKITSEITLDQSHLRPDKSDGRKLPVAEVRPVFQDRALPSIGASESLPARLNPGFQMKTKSLNEDCWHQETFDEQPDYQNIPRPKAFTSEDSSSLYEEPLEASLRDNLVENANYQKAVISSGDHTFACAQPDTKDSYALNFCYDSGSSC